MLFCHEFVRHASGAEVSLRNLMWSSTSNDVGHKYKRFSAFKRFSEPKLHRSCSGVSVTGVSLLSISVHAVHTGLSCWLSCWAKSCWTTPLIKLLNSLAVSYKRCLSTAAQAWDRLEGAVVWFLRAVLIYQHSGIGKLFTRREQQWGTFPEDEPQLKTFELSIRLLKNGALIVPLLYTNKVYELQKLVRG